MTRIATIRRAAAVACETEKPAARLRLAASGNPAFSEQPLDGQQLSSVYAVIAYVAHSVSLKAGLVQARLEMKFGVENVSSIRRCDFPDAIEFLLDLRMRELSSRR